ncbi:Tetratricopeptide repeat (TPR)-like superfamily protein [Zea mays]|uniref:Tetratricopeptide repeat (TPR)-like superfamily protein n=1 Tax=Zea mays TaxID=4577 RepID=A0A1D6F781_MAIZE|nr:Tetratricopeptide repeat (TPR)-like superfamily protein [Zea mays]
MGDACRVFDGMPHRDAVAWDAVIGGYARAGRLAEAVELFGMMRSADGAWPTEATLVYAWSGLATEVVKLFEMMKKTKVQPKHYTLIAVLTTYKNIGLVEEGMGLLKCIKEQYGSKANYKMLADIYVSIGRRDKADDVLRMSLSKRTGLETRL